MAVETSTRIPRSPTEEEIKELALWIMNETTAKTPDEEDVAEATSIAKDAYVAIFDNYITDSPGYAGKVMCVVWSGSPTFYNTFIYEDGKLVMQEQDK